MRIADVVIGANYGDEGKGLITDYLSHSGQVNSKGFLGLSTAVARFNGGAQAGHTVQLADGTRHVFSHFGSGTLNGTPTILTRHFIVSPMMFFKELIKLLNINGMSTPEVYVSPDALVTSPFDVAINQTIEIARGALRHGSCGMGVGETVERNLRPEFQIRVRDIACNDLTNKLLEIRDVYVPMRLAQFGVEITDEAKRYLTIALSDEVITAFLEDANALLKYTKVRDDNEALDLFGYVVFEGAQGLLLDQDYGQMPYVTRSNTGLKNVSLILEEYDSPVDTNVHYLTRAYLTRHGAGPLDGEFLNAKVEDLPWNVDDKTNIPNTFQGTLRFAPLNVESIAKAVAHDREYLPQCLLSSTTAVVTCCDQVINPNEFSYTDSEGYFVTGTFDEMVEDLAESIHAVSTVHGNKILKSYGPTRETIHGIE